MRPLVALLALALLAAPATARAECRAAYTPDSLVSDIQSMQAALPTEDRATLGMVAKRVEENLVCLGRSAPPLVFANAYRLIGAAKMLADNDVSGAGRWWRTALEVDPSHTWDASEVPLGHPLRAAYEAQRDAALNDLVKVEGYTMAQPAGSRFLIDGRPLEEPAARMDRVHIVQQVAEDNSVRGSWKVDGNDFPPQVLKKVVAAAPGKQPKKSGKGPQVVSEASDDGVARVIVQRVRPKEKTPLLLAGAAGMLGAGGVYALAWSSRQTFEAATTTQQLEAARDTTNLLVMASGGVFAVGMGVGYWGAILGRSGAPVPVVPLSD